ncbi:MAG: acyl carrier protein [Candidatus Muiribacteriota bacterium]|jgi:acyl carrier protein
MAIFDEVKEVIVEQIGCDENAITAEASFIDDLGADSLDIVEIMMALEEKYDIEIPDEDAEKIKSVGDAVKYIESSKN